MLRTVGQVLLNTGRLVGKALTSPRRLRQVITSPSELRDVLKHTVHYRRAPTVWTESETGVRSRLFESYESYVEHQKSKVKWKNLGSQETWRDLLRGRALADGVRPGASVLCLGARSGHEVRAFIDLGCFAVGVDLQPTPENRLVVYGDFHHLQYAEQSVDVVFTNSLDHALYLDGCIKEARRVLRRDGILIVEAGDGQAGNYEAAEWRSIDDLITTIEGLQFKLKSRARITAPWRGEHLVFTAT